MRLTIICESVDAQILRYSNINDAGNHIIRACRDITSEDIYVSQDSTLLFVALLKNEPVGCVWGKIAEVADSAYAKSSGDVFYAGYSNALYLDVVVAHRYRGGLIGPALMRATVREYFKLKREYDGDLFLACEVVNPKLAGLLQRRYNFQPIDQKGNWGEGEWTIDTPFLVYDGSPISSRG
jgi:GNAT superfamily N-acetyltransferase